MINFKVNFSSIVDEFLTTMYASIKESIKEPTANDTPLTWKDENCKFGEFELIADKYFNEFMKDYGEAFFSIVKERLGRDIVFITLLQQLGQNMSDFVLEKQGCIPCRGGYKVVFAWSFN